MGIHDVAARNNRSVPKPQPGETETRPERPGWAWPIFGWVRDAPGWVADLVVTVLVTVVTVAPQLAERRPWWVVVTAFVAAVPLLWRRRAPLVTGAVVGTAITVLACAHALPALPYGTVVCAYTIAAYSGSAARWTAAAVGALGILVSLALPNEPVEAYGYAALSFSTAWTLGTGVRARHAQIDLLRERALRLDEERSAAVARERVRIARDVHDIVTHALGSMIVQAETGPILTSTDPERVDAVFAGIADTGRTAVRDLRHSLAVLRDDSSFDRFGAEQARHQPGIATIPDLVDGARRGGLTAELVENGTRRTPSSEIDVTAYRVVQQALANTLEHARADRVQVLLEWSEGHLSVQVRDDGVGPVGAQPGGSGLAGLRARVESCGGRLFSGGSGPGFTVRAELPLTQEI